MTETLDSSFLDTSIVYKKFDFSNKTFLYSKIHKNGRVKHCSSYLILWSKFHFQVFKFTFLKVVIDFVIIWRILILAICLILILWKNLCYNFISFLPKSNLEFFFKAEWYKISSIFRKKTISVKIKLLQFSKNVSRNEGENFCHYFSYYDFASSTL